MNKKPLSLEERREQANAARWLIASLSAATVFGLWNLHVRSAPDASAATTQPAEATQTAPEMVYELPAMPTLIPPLPSQADFSLAAAPAVAQTVSPVPAVAAPAKILLGGTRPQAKKIAPKPVTRTRSSK